MTPLQVAVVRLASTNPSLRPHLLPLVRVARLSDEGVRIIQTYESDAQWEGHVPVSQYDDLPRDVKEALDATGASKVDVNRWLGFNGLRLAAWENLPKGWTEESVKKMWATLTGDTKHKITKCMKEMEGKVDNTGAFCGSLASHVGYRGAADASLLKRAMVRVAHSDKAARAQILPMVTRRA